jgi:hypothetical protein
MYPYAARSLDFLYNVYIFCILALYVACHPLWKSEFINDRQEDGDSSHGHVVYLFDFCEK